ncbi:leu operon leader peptide [Shimwellia pseudoproteus]|nr:leu operon leader peptide [Shimwellia pseudoproteus]
MLYLVQLALLNFSDKQKHLLTLTAISSTTKSNSIFLEHDSMIRTQRLLGLLLIASSVRGSLVGGIEP